jgi:hypothetical protein
VIWFEWFLDEAWKQWCFFGNVHGCNIFGLGSGKSNQHLLFDDQETALPSGMRSFGSRARVPVKRHQHRYIPLNFSYFHETLFKAFQ